MPFYLVKITAVPEKPVERLIEAANKAQAVNYAADKFITAESMKTADVVAALGRGLKVEKVDGND